MHRGRGGGAPVALRARADALSSASPEGAPGSERNLPIARLEGLRQARHWNDIMMNGPLYARIEALWRQREALGLKK